MRSLWIFAGVVAAKEVVYNWSLGWKTVNPDGLKERLVVTINDQFPLPVVRVKKGDNLVVNVENSLYEPERNATVHFHGMFQNGTSYMDGPPMLSQCPQPPGSTFQYNFTVNQTGTYWYHAHVDDLYPDGYRQVFLVEEDEKELPLKYDEELAFSLSDWYHDLYATIRDTKFMTLYNPSGAEPVPASLLFNDTTQFATEIKSHTTYRLRIVNTATFSSFYWFIENQNVTVVEVDGVFVEPYETSVLYMTAGQRFSVIFKTGSASVYRMGQVADSTVYDVVPPNLQLNHTGFLHHAGVKNLKQMSVEDIFNAVPKVKGAKLKSFSSEDIVRLNDMELVPADHMLLLENPDHKFEVTMELTNLLDGKNYAFFNGISYVPPKVPSLYSLLTAPDDETAANATIYGSNTNTFVVEHNDVVQLALNNYDAGIHPFHLHGHNFQVLVQAPSLGDEEEDFNPWNPDKAPKFAKYPLRRDVIAVQPWSHILLRWRADNPGVWFFHCHIEWHLTQGLALQFVEAPLQVRQNQKVPEGHLQVCNAVGVPAKGNAAAKTDFFDLKGQNLQERPLPEGFTLKGYVGMGLSIIAALVGLSHLVWYSIDVEKDELTN